VRIRHGRVVPLHDAGRNFSSPTVVFSDQLRSMFLLPKRSSREWKNGSRWDMFMLNVPKSRQLHASIDPVGPAGRVVHIRQRSSFSHTSPVTEVCPFPGGFSMPNSMYRTPVSVGEPRT